MSASKPLNGAPPAKAGVPLIAPGLMWLEVRNALLTGVRRGRWTGAQADAAVAQLANLPVQRLDSPADDARAYELARRYDNCPVYGMVYVALAERLAHLGWVCGISP
jgi:predicted nucleic acid-binding protein